MSAYRTSAAGLLRLATEGSLADRVDEYLRMSRQRASPSEQRSWSRSLAVLGQDLADAGLGDVEVLVEYQLPLTNRRIDAVLAGINPRTGADSFIVVELKQWSHATASQDADTLFEVPRIVGPRLHPGIQVSRYCNYLTDFLGALADQQDPLRGVAYLHNAVDHDVTDLFNRSADEHSRIFTKQRRGDFIGYLRSHLAPTSGARSADRLLASSVRPNQQLLTHAAEQLNGRSQFTLLDEQQVAYDLVMRAVERARSADHKTVVVVSGGPGSGKSVIALSLLGELARQNRGVLHATGSKSFTETMRKYAGKGSKRFQEMFKYFYNFMAAERNGFDVLICDEAHRIREESGTRYTPRALRNGRAQLDELIAAARVPVFLLDEHQVVRPGELGNVDVISAYARTLGINVEIVSLHGQFRCGGSELYEPWVTGLLGLEDGETATWEGDGLFELGLADSPEEMELFLAKKQQANETARMSAGFCWKWSDKSEDDRLVADVKIGDWARPWNAKGDRAVGDAPASSYWATDPRGFGQIGCIYTAQGFEYLWSGVIIGPDLVARDGKLVTRRKESKDPKINAKSLSDAAADRLIRNTYKVLLTRGLRGTIIYSTDAETREYLKRFVRVTRRVKIPYEPIAPGVFKIS